MENPEFSKIDNMTPENIVNCNIVEDWGVSNDRCLGYTLKNHNHIVYLVQKL